MRTTAEELRKVLLPVELAEAELAAKPAAAVMVLLRRRGGSLDLLLGQRARREGDPWSGQIGLPGGRHHDADGSMLATALRETREEFGVSLDGGTEVLGHMAPRSPGNVPDLLVVPFVALVAREVHLGVGPEIEEAFWTPIEELPPAWGRTRVLTSLGELTVPAYLWKNRSVWGFTYRVLEELLVLLDLGR